MSEALQPPELSEILDHGRYGHPLVVRGTVIESALDRLRTGIEETEQAYAEILGTEVIPSDELDHQRKATLLENLKMLDEHTLWFRDGDLIPILRKAIEDGMKVGRSIVLTPLFDPVPDKPDLDPNKSSHATDEERRRKALLSYQMGGESESAVCRAIEDYKEYIDTTLEFIHTDLVDVRKNVDCGCMGVRTYVGYTDENRSLESLEFKYMEFERCVRGGGELSGHDYLNALQKGLEVLVTEEFVVAVQSCVCANRQYTNLALGVVPV